MYQSLASGHVSAALFGPCDICRTNASLIKEAIASIGGEDRIAFQGGPGKLQGELSVSEYLVDNATSIFTREPTPLNSNTSIAGQKDWGFVYARGSSAFTATLNSRAIVCRSLEQRSVQNEVLYFTCNSLRMDPGIHWTAARMQDARDICYMMMKKMCKVQNKELKEFGSIEELRVEVAKAAEDNFAENHEMRQIAAKVCRIS